MNFPPVEASSWQREEFNLRVVLLKKCGILLDGVNVTRDEFMQWEIRIAHAASVEQGRGDALAAEIDEGIIIESFDVTRPLVPQFSDGHFTRVGGLGSGTKFDEVNES